MVTIEPGGEATIAQCPDCGRLTRTVWGYVSRDQKPCAAYFARWTDGHVERGAQILVSVGNWGKDAAPSQRRSVGIECRMGADCPGFTVVDAATLPWSGEAFLGEQLSGEAALSDRIAQEVYAILDCLIVEDSRINHFLLSDPQ